MVAMGFETSYRPIAPVIDGAGFTSAETHEQAYARELSKRILGLGAALYRNSGVAEIRTEGGIVASKLEIAPLAVLLGAMFVYG